MWDVDGIMMQTHTCASRPTCTLDSNEWYQVKSGTELRYAFGGLYKRESKMADFTKQMTWN